MARNLLERIKKWRPNWKTLLRDVLIIFVLFIVLDFWQRRNLIESGAVLNPQRWELQTLSGKEPQSIQPEKPTVIYSFAPWCSVCKLSIPALDNFYKNSKDEVNVMLVAFDFQDLQSLQDFKSEVDIEMPILLGNRTILKELKVDAFPTLYFLNKYNEIASSKVGYTPAWLLKLKLAFL